MSAFVVDPETIDAVATAMDMARNDSRQFPSHLAKILERHHCPTKPAFLGLAMHALNVDAVSQRYPGDDTLESLPGVNGPKVYEYKSVRSDMLSRCTVLKAMRCWLYQCSEGTASDQPVFKAIEEVSHELAFAIVSDLPEYEKAEWH